MTDTGSGGFVARVNVVTGTIRVIVPGAEDTDFCLAPGNRLCGLAGEVEPWGAEETGMRRADEQLAAMGWRRVTTGWAGEEILTCRVVPAAGVRLCTADVAERLNIRPATWRKYVSTGYGPAPDGHHDARSPWWWASTVDWWDLERHHGGSASRRESR